MFEPLQLLRPAAAYPSRRRRRANIPPCGSRKFPRCFPRHSFRGKWQAGWLLERNGNRFLRTDFQTSVCYGRMCWNEKCGLHVGPSEKCISPWLRGERPRQRNFLSTTFLLEPEFCNGPGRGVLLGCKSEDFTPFGSAGRHQLRARFPPKVSETDRSRGMFDCIVVDYNLIRSFGENLVTQGVILNFPHWIMLGISGGMRKKLFWSRNSAGLVSSLNVRIVLLRELFMPS